jgi:hypothetical protein
MRTRFDSDARRLLITASSILFATFATEGTARSTPAARDAKPSKPTLVFESHTGERPAELANLLDALAGELEDKGFAARPATILRVADGGVPRPGIIDRGLTVEMVAQMIEDGSKRYRDGDPQATTVLTTAIGSIQRNPALFVFDVRNSELTFSAYATLALAQKRFGAPTESSATMLQLIRTFPARPLSRAEYGPDGERLYREVSTQVSKLGRGRLTIEANDPQAVVFVNGQIRGRRNAAVADLIPGTYRVFIQVPGTLGRQFEVEVRANEEASLKIEDVDTWLWATDSWIGFSFPTDSLRGREARYAGELARRWTGADVVAVIGSARIQNKPVLIGSLYRTDGTLLRSAVLSATTAGAPALRALAAFLANGTIAEGIDDIQIVKNTNDRSASRGAEVDRSSRSLRRTATIVLSAGGALLATGIGLYVSGSSTDPVAHQTSDDLRPFGVVFGLGALATIGTGAYLLTTHHPERAAAVSAGIGGLGAIAIGVGFIAISDRQTCFGHEQDPQYQCQYMWSSANKGWPLVGLGVASVGLGVYLYLHARPKHSIGVSLQPSRGGTMALISRSW